MNDLLKLCSKALKPFGYQIKPLNGLNFLSIPNLAGSKHGENIGAILKASEIGKKPVEQDSLNELQVFFRTCVRANRNVDTRPRVTGASLEENMLRCLNSLLKAIDYAAGKQPRLNISLLILDDRSDADVMEKVGALVDNFTSSRFTVSWKTTDVTGQGPSLHEQFLLAKGSGPRLVYFIEDDYLHEIDAIHRLCEFYREMSGKIGSHLVLYPQEHPVMYDHHYPSYIVTGKDRHWRTIRHTTHSFFTHTDVVKTHWKFFENTRFVGDRKKRRLGSENKTTNRIFKYIPAFAPLRALAVHLQFDATLPPLYDWRSLWAANAVELPEKKALEKELTPA